MKMYISFVAFMSMMMAASHPSWSIEDDHRESLRGRHSSMRVKSTNKLIEQPDVQAATTFNHIHIHTLSGGEGKLLTLNPLKLLFPLEATNCNIPFVTKIL